MNSTEKQNYAAAFLNANDVTAEEQSDLNTRSDVSTPSSIQIGEISCENLIGSVTVLLYGRPIYYQESNEGKSFSTGKEIPLVFDEVQVILADEAADVKISNSTVYTKVGE